MLLEFEANRAIDLQCLSGSASNSRDRLALNLDKRLLLSLTRYLRTKRFAMYDDVDDIDESMLELNDEASYVCGSCGEDIVVPVDSSEGRQQQYVEDCPVCCCPNVIYVEIEEDGFTNVRSHLE